MADGGGAHDYLIGLTLAEREMLRRIRGCDGEGKGCFASVEFLAKGNSESDVKWSISQAREIIRRLREKGVILLAGVRRRDWTHVYLFPDRTYRERDLDLCPKATAALLANSVRYVEQAPPERKEGAAAGWSITAARARVQAAAPDERQGAPLPKVVQIKGVYINSKLLKRFSRERLERAVSAMLDYYGPKLDQKGGVRHPASWLAKKCERMAQAEREPQPQKETPAAGPASTSAPVRAEPRPVDPVALQRAQELERANAEGNFFEVFQRQIAEAARDRAQTEAPAGLEPAPLASSELPTLEEGPAATAAASAGDVPTIGQAVRRWVELKKLETRPRTQDYYNDRIPLIDRLVGDVPVTQWNHDAVLDYAKRRGNVKTTTIKRELNMIKGALKLLRRRSKQMAARLDDPAVYWPPLRAVVEGRKEYLRRGDLPKLLRALDQEYQRDFVLWGVYTGGRLGELRGLQWEDLDTEGARIHIRGTKTRKADRWVPLSEELVLWCVERRSMQTRTGPILKRWHNVQRDLALACERASLQRLSPNSLRRTFGSWLRQRSVSDAVIAELMGHEDITMIGRVYGQLTEEQAREAISKL